MNRKGLIFRRMALSKSMQDLRDMSVYFNVPQFIQHAAADPGTLYATVGRVLATLTRARAAARIEKIQIDTMDEYAYRRRRRADLRLNLPPFPARAAPYPPPVYPPQYHPVTAPPQPAVPRVPGSPYLPPPRDLIRTLTNAAPLARRRTSEPPERKPSVMPDSTTSGSVGTSDEEIDIEAIDPSPTCSTADRPSPCENVANGKTRLPAKRRLADIAADLHAKKAKEKNDLSPSRNNANILKVLQSKPSPVTPLTPLSFVQSPAFDLMTSRADFNPDLLTPRSAITPEMLGHRPSLSLEQLTPHGGIFHFSPFLAAVAARAATVTPPVQTLSTDDPAIKDRKIKIGRPPKNSLPCGQDSNGSFSRHNDMVYYPNIQCLLCEEWVCSRNRYMHIESHLQYKPYKCSICGYDNRKEIFITLHLRRVHGGKGEVLYTPNPELEKKAWTIAEECLQHTRQLLISQNSNSAEQQQQQQQSSVSPTEKLAEYTDVYRAKISNTQRAEKTQIIEESRQMGIFPGFARTTIEREIKCEACSAFVIRSSTVTEEHVRSHLSIPSYACIVPGCETAHSSRLFMLRHMKEVHKLRKSPDDLMTWKPGLLDQYVAMCQKCFPAFFTPEALERIEMKYSADLSSPHTPISKPSTAEPRTDDLANPDCLSCKFGLSIAPGKACINCMTASPEQMRVRCTLCSMELTEPVGTLLRHAISHLRPLPFGCSHCNYSHWAPAEVERHTMTNHTTVISRVTWNYERSEMSRAFLAGVRDCFGNEFMNEWMRA